MSTEKNRGFYSAFYNVIKTADHNVKINNVLFYMYVVSGTVESWKPTKFIYVRLKSSRNRMSGREHLTLCRCKVKNLSYDIEHSLCEYAGLYKIQGKQSSCFVHKGILNLKPYLTLKG